MSLQRIVDLELALDALLPPQRPLGGPGAALIHAAHEWSELVWRVAQEAGPLPLDAEHRGQGRALAQRPVFICGAHRSGTTLLRDLLDNHPALVVLPSEGHVARLRVGARSTAEVLHELSCEWLRRLANPINQPPYWVLGRSTADQSPYVEFARALMGWWQFAETELEIATAWPIIPIALAYASCTSGLSGSARWVEKTPGNEREIDRLFRGFPDAIVIHVVRDPVAVFASRKILEVRARGSFAAHRIARDLARSYQVAAQKISEGNARNYVVIRYEDLLANPEQVMRMTAAALHIEYVRGLLEPTVAGAPSRSNSSFAPGTAIGEIDKPSAAHHEVLTSVERDVLAGVVGPAAARFGYAVQPLRPWRARVFRALSIRGAGRGAIGR